MEDKRYIDIRRVKENGYILRKIYRYTKSEGR